MPTFYPKNDEAPDMGQSYYNAPRVTAAELAAAQKARHQLQVDAWARTKRAAKTRELHEYLKIKWGLRKLILWLSNSQCRRFKDAHPETIIAILDGINPEFKDKAEPAAPEGL